jgi:hypothetical protein
MHRRVYRGRGTTFAVEAEVEGSDHLVLAVGAGVGAGQRPQPVETQDSEARLRERPEVATRTFDVKEFSRSPGDRVGGEGLA